MVGNGEDSCLLFLLVQGLDSSFDFAFLFCLWTSAVTADDITCGLGKDISFGL